MQSRAGANLGRCLYLDKKENQDCRHIYSICAPTVLAQPKTGGISAETSSCKEKKVITMSLRRVFSKTSSVKHAVCVINIYLTK